MLPKLVNNNIKPNKITFLKLVLKKKIKNMPNKNKINGILFPESIIPTPNKFIMSIINIYLK